MNCPWCNAEPKLERGGGYSFGDEVVSYGCHNGRCHVQPQVQEWYNSAYPESHDGYVSFVKVKSKLKAKWEMFHEAVC